MVFLLVNLISGSLSLQFSIQENTPFPGSYLLLVCCSLSLLSSRELFLFLPLADGLPIFLGLLSQVRTALAASSSRAPRGPRVASTAPLFGSWRGAGQAALCISPGPQPGATALCEEKAQSAAHPHPASRGSAGGSSCGGTCFVPYQCLDYFTFPFILSPSYRTVTHSLH